jgi:hypothetical protein
MLCNICFTMYTQKKRRGKSPCAAAAADAVAALAAAADKINFVGRRLLQHPYC